MPYDILPSDAAIGRAAQALEANNFTVHVVPDGAAAKAKLMELLPAGVEVMDMTSMTLATISAADAIGKSGAVTSVRRQLEGMDSQTQPREKKQLGAAPAWVVGSVHAVTEDGHVLVASNSGSQLPAYAFGADHVIWIVGGQKIVPNTDAGIRRIYEHALPLESERARKAYGVPGSAVNKLLIVNREIQAGRITIIVVKEQLGF